MERKLGRFQLAGVISMGAMAVSLAVGKHLTRECYLGGGTGTFSVSICTPHLIVKKSVARKPSNSVPELLLLPVCAARGCTGMDGC